MAMFPLAGGCVDTRNAASGTKLTITEYLHHSFSTAQGHVYILKNHNVVVAKENIDQFQVQVSLFTNGRMRSAILTENMLWLMKSTSANRGFMNEAMEKLQNNPITKNGQFDISLTEASGTRHRFVLARTARNQLHILTYERI
jgi:hypothetical protein